MKNVLTPLAKSVLIPLRLTAGASAADGGFHKKYLVMISNKEMEGIIEILRSLEYSDVT